MGYYVDVEGKIIFNNVEGFKKEFDTIAQRRNSEIGMHGDFDYFFTKMWGDNLENLEAKNGIEFPFKREGKFWFDDIKAMEFLVKFVNGEVIFYGEDGRTWKFLLNEGIVKKLVRKYEWVEEQTSTQSEEKQNG